jgi:outer membrane protein assembly factor BamE (lipoprotein component of BamABCDE complex)
MRFLLLCAGLALGLAACDPARVAKLEEGVATEAQVRQQFGDPATLVEKADGSKVLEYPRQPEGGTNYRIVIGPDGKMSSLRQLLNADNFARVQPGQTQDEVRERLGRPAEMRPWPLQHETEWTWRFHPDANQTKLFSVTFDADGRVKRSGVFDDPRAQVQAGR